MLFPVIIILLISYYIKYIVNVDNFQVNPSNLKLAALDGALTVNDDLSRASILWNKEGVISAVKLNDHLYLGTTNGRVIKYNPIKNEFITITQFNAKITSMRPSIDGNLYLLSVCTGVFKLDLTTRRLLLIYDHRSKEHSLNPSNATHLNDFLVLPGEPMSFLIAQSSRRWTSRQTYYSHLEADRTGQLIKYTPKTDKLEIVKKNLAFPKGLEMSSDKKSVLISEFLGRRILRLYLEGAKKDQLEIVAENLPGEPNHIRKSELRKEDTFWVPVNAGRNSTNYGYLDMIGNNVIVKEILLYLIKGVEDLFVIFSRFIDADYWTFKWNSYILDIYSKDFKHGLIIEIDSKGKILNSLHSSTGRLTNIEEVLEINLNKEKNIFLTSAYNQFIAKLNL